MWRHRSRVENHGPTARMSTTCQWWKQGSPNWPIAAKIGHVSMDRSIVHQRITLTWLGLGCPIEIWRQGAHLAGILAYINGPCGKINFKLNLTFNTITVTVTVAVTPNIHISHFHQHGRRKRRKEIHQIKLAF